VGSTSSGLDGERFFRRAVARRYLMGIWQCQRQSLSVRSHT
jgi:hypothetical protein